MTNSLAGRDMGANQENKWTLYDKSEEMLFEGLSDVQIRCIVGRLRESELAEFNLKHQYKTDLRARGNQLAFYRRELHLRKMVA